MSQETHAVKWQDAIRSTSTKFDEFKLLDYKAEAVFATQACLNNDTLRKTAQEDSTSLKLAMFNVAAIGLSLNPSQGLAYLVPRKGKVILDISYRGLIALAVETGSILWAKAELVYTNDEFVYKGPAEKPDHTCDPFSTNRGEVRGGYCIAELPGGGVLVEPMSRADMDKIKATSAAANGPWKNWEDQMQLKSVVKRASKWWPKTTPRFAAALQILNEENGEGITLVNNQDVPSSPGTLPPPPTRDQVSSSTIEFVDKLIFRAKSNGAYEACKELAQSRLSDPSELSYAFNQIDLAIVQRESDLQELAESSGMIIEGQAQAS